jgi:hypothetical protein
VVVHLPHVSVHVPGRNTVHPYGRAVQVQEAGIYGDIPAMSNDTVVALSILPSGIFQFHLTDVPVILADSNNEILI